MKVSIVLPVYNEEQTIKEIIARVKVAPFGFEAERELIAVNDGSRDKTRELLDAIPGITVIHFDINKGKGAALKAGFERATGDVVLVQDVLVEFSRVFQVSPVLPHHGC